MMYKIPENIKVKIIISQRMESNNIYHYSILIYHKNNNYLNYSERNDVIHVALQLSLKKSVMYLLHKTK